jgi:hypothetical protein
MKRIFALVALLTLWVAPVRAQEIVRTPQPVQPDQASQADRIRAPRPTRPHRFQISSFGVWVRTEGPGYPAYRYTYRGETYGFPRPAIFTYGYEHEMQENGPFTLNGQWH